MKPNAAAPPCAAQRPRLAEWALGALSPAETRELRLHLEGCPGCRRYWEEMNGLCRHLQQAAENLPDAQAGERFHRELRNRMRHGSARPGRTWWPWPARWALPSALAAAAGVAVALFWPRPSTQPQPAPSLAHQPAPSVPASASTAPTWIAYQRIANASLETFDEVITRQALLTAPASPAPVIYALSRGEVEE